MRTIEGTQYVNVGDWVQSCTALAEHESGRLELLRWIPEGHGLQDEIPADTPLSQENHTPSAEILDSELQPNREA